MEETLVLATLVVATVVKKTPSRWSREWLLKRGQYSHINILKELRGEPEDWRNYVRMDVATYMKLLSLVTPETQKSDTVMRNVIIPLERLTETLRFLAAGRSYKDMEFSTVISKQSLSKIVPETCHALYNVLKEKYMKISGTHKTNISVWTYT
jgi:hypothetical protein